MICYSFFFLLFLSFLSILSSNQCSTIQLSNINIIKPLHNSKQCLNSSLLLIGAPISSYYKDLFYLQGLQMLNGWKIFIEYINYEKKGIVINNITYFLELIYIEDYSSSKTVKEITSYLIHDYHVNYMFGPYSSPLTIASTSITEANNMTLISSGAPIPEVFENTNYAYGLLPAASTYSEGAFRAFNILGAKNISVISDTDVSICNNISSNLYATKYNLSLFKHYDVNISDINYHQTVKNILQELKKNKVQTIFGCSFSSLCELVNFHLLIYLF